MKHTATIRRLGSAALLTGVASVALAAPASAVQRPPDPDGDGVTVTDTGTSGDDGWEFAQVATGAVGGIALVGAGAAATVLLRRHSRHTAHPA